MDVINEYKEYDGISLSSLEYLQDESFYNHCHYIGLQRIGNDYKDIIYAESDDNSLTELYDISNGSLIHIGYCFNDEDDIIHITNYQFT